jgi:hypothetical protein
MKLRIILIALVLLMLAAPATACPPMSLVDKINWQKANNYTEVNASYWMDGQGNLYNVTFESHVDQNNILGFKYGDFCEWYTYQLDGKTIISGCENLDQKHRDHEMMNGPMYSLQNFGAVLCGMLPCIGGVAILTLIGVVITIIHSGPVPPNGGK